MQSEKDRIRGWLGKWKLPTAAQTTAFIDSLIHSTGKHCERLKWAKKIVVILVFFNFSLSLSYFTALEVVGK